MFKKEIAQFAICKGERPERFEPKPLASYRDMVFAAEVLNRDWQTVHLKTCL